jgi:myo-inositol-1(or 4)-monophosphatase
MFGSAALDLAWLAEGRTDATVMLANKPWDTAAGVLLAREAGAVVVDGSGALHTFASAETIAVGPGIADAVLSLLDDAQVDRNRSVNFECLKWWFVAKSRSS